MATKTLRHCNSCGGTGRSTSTCFSCNGTGRKGSSVCSRCRGIGVSPCSSCGGAGTREETVYTPEERAEQKARRAAKESENKQKQLQQLAILVGGSITALAIFMVKKPQHPISVKVRQFLKTNDMDIRSWLEQNVPQEMQGAISNIFADAIVPVRFCYKCGKGAEVIADNCDECGEVYGKAICFACQNEVEWGFEFCPLCKKPMIYKSLAEIEIEKEMLESKKPSSFESAQSDPIAQLINENFVTNLDDKIYTFSAIPEEMAITACNNFVDKREDEMIFMLIETTLAGSALVGKLSSKLTGTGMTGIVFTNVGIYWMNIAEKNKNHVKYNDISHVEGRRGKIASLPSWIVINKNQTIKVGKVKVFESLERLITSIATNNAPQQQTTQHLPTLAQQPVYPQTVQHPIQQQSPHPVQNAEQSSLICNACGAQVKPGAKFCTKCGNSMIQNPPERNVCKACGAKHEEAVGFCSECGQKM